MDAALTAHPLARHRTHRHSRAVLEAGTGTGKGPGLFWWKKNLFLIPPWNHCILCAQIRQFPPHPPWQQDKGGSGGHTSSKVFQISSVALVLQILH